MGRGRLTRVDASGLYCAASQIEDEAGLLRARAAQVACQLDTMRWVSPAAGVARAGILDAANRLRAAALTLDDFADAVRRAGAQLATLQ